MGWVSVVLFFVYCYGLGFSLSFFVRRDAEGFFERVLMRLGFGLAGFVVLGVVLNAVGVPLDWRVFLGFALLPWAFVFGRDFFLGRRPSFRLRRSGLALVLVAAIFGFSLFMYAWGSFRYPYLEDEDPWGHAVGAKYVALEKRAFDTEVYNFAYIDPYPPGYDIVMGVLHQTEPSVQFTLKFFNALIISLGIVWFFFAARFFVGAWKAVFAAFVLAMLPSYFTHFIWAHTLVIALFFPAMYALWMVKEDRFWLVPASVSIAAILLTQPDQPLKLAVMFAIFLGVRAWHERRLPVYEVAAGLLGVFISLSWWAFKAWEMFGYATGIGKGGSAFSSDGGSASRAYSLRDLFFPYDTHINVSPGWGFVVAVLVLLGFVVAVLSYRRVLRNERPWLVVALLWFAFAFMGTNSVTFNLPVGLNAFRFWLLLAIPVALMAAEGAWFVASFSGLRVVRVAVVLLLALGVGYTSGVHKFDINTAPAWYTALHPMSELPAYLWLYELPEGTRIISNVDESFIIGLDRFACVWCPEVVDFKRRFLDMSPAEIASFMRENDYMYLLFSALAWTPSGEMVPDQVLLEKEAEVCGLVQESGRCNSTLFEPVKVHLNGAVSVFRLRG